MDLRKKLASEHSLVNNFEKPVKVLEKRETVPQYYNNDVHGWPFAAKKTSNLTKSTLRTKKIKGVCRSLKQKALSCGADIFWLLFGFSGGMCGEITND